ncbi:MAG: hypothetical protein R2755_14190 [Acidimicrobiales bacterium]
MLFPEPAAAWRRFDRDFVTSVAMLCSEALRRIRLGEIERRAEARAAALHRVTESFSRSLTMDEVIATAVSAVIDAMAPATAGATVRLEGGRYKQWAWDGTRGAPRSTSGGSSRARPHPWSRPCWPMAGPASTRAAPMWSPTWAPAPPTPSRWPPEAFIPLDHR